MILQPEKLNDEQRSITEKLCQLFPQIGDNGVEISSFGNRGQGIVADLTDGGIHNEPPSKNVLGGCEF